MTYAHTNHTTEYRALERLVALAEAAAPNMDYTRDPATRKALSVKELAILLRCGHQWAFAGCVGACAERILDVLEEGEGACVD